MCVCILIYSRSNAFRSFITHRFFRIEIDFGSSERSLETTTITRYIAFSLALSSVCFDFFSFLLSFFLFSFFPFFFPFFLSFFFFFFFFFLCWYAMDEYTILVEETLLTYVSVSSVLRGGPRRKSYGDTIKIFHI